MNKENFKYLFVNKSSSSNRCVFISKLNLLEILNNSFTNDCFHIHTEDSGVWDIHTEEHSIVPETAGRFISIYERIFEAKVSKIEKDKNGLFIYF